MDDYVVWAAMLLVVSRSDSVFQPDDAQQLKLARIARTLNAYAVGDDGEHYTIQRSFLGREKLVTHDPDA